MGCRGDRPGYTALPLGLLFVVASEVTPNSASMMSYGVARASTQGNEFLENSPVRTKMSTRLWNVPIFSVGYLCSPIKGIRTRSYLLIAGRKTISFWRLHIRARANEDVYEGRVRKQNEGLTKEPIFKSKMYLHVIKLIKYFCWLGSFFEKLIIMRLRKTLTCPLTLTETPGFITPY